MLQIKPQEKSQRDREADRGKTDRPKIISLCPIASIPSFYSIWKRIYFNDLTILKNLQNFEILIGLLEEDKPLYFPKGSFLDAALKYSPVKDHQLLYQMIEKHNSFITYSGEVAELLSVFCGAARFGDLERIWLLFA